MYIQTSRYKAYTRVRIVKKVRHGGKLTTQLVEHIGSAHSDEELILLQERARQRMDELIPVLPFAAAVPNATNDGEQLIISSSYAYGLWKVIGGIYDDIGLPSTLLKYLVLARVALPQSKLRTAQYLQKNLAYPVSASAIYKHMDSLDKDALLAILVAYAQKKIRESGGCGITVVFYDVTTLYFETDSEDMDSEDGTGLRKKGYSKDFRYDLPQVVVGLTVDGKGFPLDFQVYEGSTYEGKTLLDGILLVKAKLALKSTELTVVADAGMLSQSNIEQLEKEHFRYIVGARLKSMTKAMTDKVCTHPYEEKGMLEVTLKNTATQHQRIIVTYSDKRAKRTKRNRSELIRKLQEKLDHGQIVKKSKYVVLGTHETFHGSIDNKKVESDQRFDGLKGYITNTDLQPAAVVEQYSNLWKVEKSFRMSKSDLRARPTFHFKKPRIIAHLVICVCALAVLREFDRKIQQLPELGLSQALDHVLSIRKFAIKLPHAKRLEAFSELSATDDLLLNM